MKQVDLTEKLPHDADVVLDMTGQIDCRFKRRLSDEHVHAGAVDDCKARRT